MENNFLYNMTWLQIILVESKLLNFSASKLSELELVYEFCDKSYKLGRDIYNVIIATK